MPEDAKSDITDNVIMGDFTHIANKIDSELRATCESCHASGNFTIFVCNNTNCSNKFCEHCKDSAHPKKCSICIQEILKKERAISLAEEQVASAAAAEAERVRYLAELAAYDELQRKTLAQAEDLEKRRLIQVEKASAAAIETELRRKVTEKQKRHDKKVALLHYNSTPAKLFRHRNIIWPVEYIICFYMLFLAISKSVLHDVPYPEQGAIASSPVLYVVGVYIIFIAISLLITYVSTMAGTGEGSDNGKEYLTYMAENGYASKRATISLFSPIISMTCSLLIVLIFGLQILFLTGIVTLIVIGIVVLMFILAASQD